MTIPAVSPYDMYGCPASCTMPAAAARTGVYSGAATSRPLWNPPRRAPKYEVIWPFTGHPARRGAAGIAAMGAVDTGSATVVGAAARAGVAAAARPSATNASSATIAMAVRRCSVVRPSNAMLREVRQRVHRVAVEDRHEVQVWAGRETGHADVRDHLARRNGLPGLHDRRTRAVVQMDVLGLEVRVVADDHDHRAVLLVADVLHDARRRGAYRRVHRRRDVEAGVEVAVAPAVEDEAAVAEVRRDRAVDWPLHELAAGVRTVEAVATRDLCGELRVELLRCGALALQLLGARALTRLSSLSALSRLMSDASCWSWRATSMRSCTRCAKSARFAEDSSISIGVTRYCRYTCRRCSP